MMTLEKDLPSCWAEVAFIWVLCICMEDFPGIKYQSCTQKIFPLQTEMFDRIFQMQKLILLNYFSLYLVDRLSKILSFFMC